MGAVAGKGAGEQSLARKLYRRLEEDWLLIADRNFFNWADWCAAADSGAQLLWRGKGELPPPGPGLPPHRPFPPVPIKTQGPRRAQQAGPEAPPPREDLDEGHNR